MEQLIHAVVREVIAREMPPITRQDLQALERMLDSIFHKLGIDIEFTRHFFERVNHERNRKQITFAELQQLFLATFRQHARKLIQYGDQYEAVLFDIGSKINVPFILEWNPGTQMLELRTKTVMRKPHFRTRSPKIVVKR